MSKDKFVKSMPAPKYFLDIVALRKPSIDKVEAMGISIGAFLEGKGETQKEKLDNITRKQEKELRLCADVYRKVILAAFSIFRITEKGEFAEAEDLNFNEKTGKISIVKCDHERMPQFIKDILKKL